MDKTEFFKHAKVGDTVDLKRCLIPNVKYGNTTYRKEMRKYGDKGLKISMLFPQAGGFMTEECARFAYTPEMVKRLIPQTTQDEIIAESFIKNKEDKTPSSQGNDTLNDLEERLTKLESEIKLIKGQIERIGVILLND